MARAIAAFKDLSDAELVTKLAETKQELFNLRFQRAQGQLENSARMGILRKDVARINMLLRNREIAAAELLHTGTPRGPRSSESTSSAGKK
jgi:large subunit ribosomal protein L29